jgi:hypothetical protein
MKITCKLVVLMGLVTISLYGKAQGERLDFAPLRETMPIVPSSTITETVSPEIADHALASEELQNDLSCMPDQVISFINSWINYNEQLAATAGIPEEYQKIMAYLLLLVQSGLAGYVLTSGGMKLLDIITNHFKSNPIADSGYLVAEPQVASQADLYSFWNQYGRVAIPIIAEN